ncbi:hypothetical protein AMAG_15754 [Allomyces macrogynus ATCC 38327]|uniref:Major facilitator superfamily (MFS) profile domain-containing protein n=1 Tax=Allomyces macrogynus (strain ATCC 38327) TaxID=578462 RepID=A0A0L0T9Z6_ALLM3|nr:hypothetical protein AMAG_15754 [Allomyces macrogynus ATCC 38327]|eukprot:KNE71541.1 hypothetical protein AMAG_15754 [Allomyces macrogynus ATCC 38327]
MACNLPHSICPRRPRPAARPLGAHGAPTSPATRTSNLWRRQSGRAPRYKVTSTPGTLDAAISSLCGPARSDGDDHDHDDHDHDDASDPTCTMGGNWLANHFSDTRSRRTLADIEKEKFLFAGHVPFKRWMLIPASIVIQVCVGSFYAWSVYNGPIKEVMGADATEESISETFYVAVGCFGVASCLIGPVLERRGPFFVSVTGAVLFLIGQMLSALGCALHQVWILYLGYGLFGGAGIGMAYITPVAVLQRWYPEKRGLASGIAVGAFGAGSVVASFTQAALLQSLGPMYCFIVLGITYFVIHLIASVVLRYPAPPRRLASLPLTATWVVGVNGFFNVLGRLLFGGLSDKLGTFPLFLFSIVVTIISMVVLLFSFHGEMFIVYCISMWVLTTTYGAALGLVPGLLTESFGPKHFGALYGVMITSWASGGVIGGVGFTAVIKAQRHIGVDKTHVYDICIYSMLPLAGLGVLLMFVLAKLRRRNKNGKAKNTVGIAPAAPTAPAA